MNQLGRLGTYCFCFNVKRDDKGVVVDTEQGIHYPLNTIDKNGNVITINGRIVVRNAVEYPKIHSVYIEGTFNGEPVYVRLGELD